MKSPMKIGIGIVFAMATLGGLSHAQRHGSETGKHDALEVREHGNIHAAPQGAKVTFENDSVVVLHIVIAPHEKVPMHDVTPRLIVWITSGRLKLTFPDGSVVDDVHKAGDAEWLDSRRHAGENMGDSPVEIAAIILKQHSQQNRTSNKMRE
jgi:hypothetical protein